MLTEDYCTNVYRLYRTIQPPVAPSTKVLTSIHFAIMRDAQTHQPDGVVWHKRRVEMRTLFQWVSTANGFVIGAESRTFSFESCFRTIYITIYIVSRKPKSHVETRVLLQWLSVVNGFDIGNEIPHLQRWVTLQDDPDSDPDSAQEAEKTCRNEDNVLLWLSVVNGGVIGNEIAHLQLWVTLQDDPYSDPCSARKPKRLVEMRILLLWLSIVNDYVIGNETTHLQLWVML